MICLINPYTYRGDDTYVPQWEICEHMGLASLASSLRDNGFECKIINAYLKEYSIKELIEIVLNEKPKLIGISILHESYAYSKEFISSIKSLLPDIPIVAGGYFPTILGTKILKHNSNIDYIVKGDGEEIIVKLANYIIQNSIKLDEIEGLIYKKNNTILENKGAGYIKNLDSYNYVARDDTSIAMKILESYSATPAIRLITSRGCLYSCSFCNIHEYLSCVAGNSSKIRRRSPENICDEIEKLINQFNNNVFIISDDDFVDKSTDSKKHIEKFFDELEKRNLDIFFGCQFRLDGFDERIFERMLKNGLIGANFGIESIDQCTLNFFQKGIKNSIIIDVLKKLTHYAPQINIAFYMLLYHPLTTIEEIAGNYEFFNKIGYFRVEKEQSIFRKILATKLQVFRGGRLEKRLAKFDLLNHYDPDELEPTTLEFNYLDYRVPEFLSSIEEERKNKDSDIQTILEKHLDIFLNKPCKLSNNIREEIACYR